MEAFLIIKKFKVDGYILTHYEEEKRYTISFVDSFGTTIESDIEEPIYNEYKRTYLSYEAEKVRTRRHIEFSELSDNELYNRAEFKPRTIFEILENKENAEKIRKVIDKFTKVQKRRFIKYYIDRKTYKEIANEEGCTYQGVEHSINWILKKFKKIFKK